MLKQQFSSIPAAYYKAARIDGCRRFRYLITVMVPMSKPTIVAIALLKLINSWNSYMWPLIVTNTNEMRTLPVALAAFSTEAGVQYNTLMAFSLMIISPILLVYFFARKYIIRG
ncbi:MAG: carbohydrate ABC transporter permease [Enterocloster bolteae]